MVVEFPDGMPILRQSERAAYKNCNWAWYQSYVLGLKPIVERKDAADFGTYFHVAMAEYYQPGFDRGPHPAETWEKLVSQHIRTIKVPGASEDDVATWEDFYPLGLAIAEAYVERYQGDPHWEILHAERRFEVTIPDVRVKPLESSKGRRGFTPIVRLVGTFDVVLRDHNEETKYGAVVKMVDHKTAARIYTDHLQLDEQASTYIAVATHVLREQGLIGPKEVVKGMEYNFIKRAKIDERVRDERGIARNNPQKRHFIEALTEWPREQNPIPPYDEDEIPKLQKMKLVELKEETDLWFPDRPIYGDKSADQGGTNFLRHFVPRTTKERQRTIVRISQEAAEMELKRSGALPVLKRPTPNCKWCSFFDLCDLDESGDDADYYIQTTMKTHDPYHDHRPDAKNSKVLTQ